MSDLLRLERTINSFVNTLANTTGPRSSGTFTLPSGSPAHHSTGTPPCAWYPTTDVLETDEAYVALLELPGVKKDAISVDLKDESTLVVSGELNEPDWYKTGTQVFIKERVIGKFARAVPLPAGHFDAEKISARMQDGLLEIRVQKSSPVVKKIDVE